MPIGFECGICTRKITAKDELAGRRIKCPGCGTVVIVPDVARAAAIYKKGEALLDAGHYDKAVLAFGKAIEYDYRDGRLFHARARAYRAIDNTDAASSDYDEAVRLSPKVAQYWWSRGNFWDDSRQFDLAIADYTRAIELDPKFVNAHVCRGDAYRNKRKYEQAIADYTAALRLDPNNVHALRSRAVAYGAVDEDDKAREDQRAVERLEQAEAIALEWQLVYAGHSTVFDAIMEYWKFKADGFWAARDKPACCDHCMKDMQRDEGFLKGGSYLLCEPCTHKILASCVEDGSSYKPFFDAARLGIPKPLIVGMLSNSDVGIWSFLG